MSFACQIIGAWPGAGWLLPFAAGIGVALLGVLGLWLLQVNLDLRRTREETERIAASAEGGERHERAWALAAESRRRLRMRKQLNPEWVAPLYEELPGLVRGIAGCFHPDAADPLRAPKLSEFSRAIELVAADISNFLQERRVGRLVDLSAGSAYRAYAKGRELAAKPKLRKAGSVVARLYRRFRPAAQALRYRSPLTWAGLAFTNAATRTLQPAIVNIVARRAIQLYSGELAAGMRVRE